MKTVTTLLLCLFLISPVWGEEFEDLYEEIDVEDTTEVVEEPTEEEIQESREEYLKKNFYTISLERGSQSGFDKYVPIIIKVTPNDTPVRTQITWDVPADVTFKEKHPEFINSMVNGETYEYKAKFRPKNPGSYELTINVTAWKYDTNYTSSESILVEFNDNLVVDPTDTNYTILLILKIFLILLSIVGLGFGIYFGAKKLIVVLGEYLKPPVD